MAGYFVYELDVFDQNGFDEYAIIARSLMSKMGGTIVLSSESVEPLEGDWHPKSLVVAKFPTAQAARDFYNCDEYKAALAMRDRAAKSRGVLIETKD